MVIRVPGTMVAIALAVLLSGASAPDRAHVTPTARAAADPHTITWDKYSLMVDGKRVFLWSGEFHYFRLPSPSLWTDVLQKIRAAGFNAVSLYFDWAYHSPKQGVYDFTGVRDVDKLLDIANRLGIYVLARPGPYINAELDAGGLPGWVMTDAPLRTDAPCTVSCPPYGSYLTQAEDWLHHVDGIIANHQLTTGTGSVIGYQIENEISGSSENAYMADLAGQVRSDGITVPLFVNDVSLNGNWLPGSTSAPWNNLYGYDNYPQGFNCSSAYSWSSAADNETRFRGFDSTTPIFIPEFQGGSFDNWGGSSYDSCATRTNEQFERVFYLTNVANGTTMENNYMTFGGTSWGWEPVENTVYSGYDYGSSITEGRLLRPKYYAEKELGLMFQSVAPLTATDPVSPAPSATNVSPVPSTSCTNGPGGGTISNCGAIKIYQRVNSGTGTNFYFVRHNDSRGTLDSSFNFPISTADGSYTIPQSGSLELNGRDMKTIVADYQLDSQHVVYSTSQIMSHATIGGQDVALLWAPRGQTGETVLRYSSQPTVTTVAGAAPAVTWDSGTGDLRLDYTHQGLTEVRITDGGTANPLLLLLADDPTAQRFWTQSTGSGQVIEEGPELVRGATVNGSQLDLTGDTSAPTTLTVWAPAGITSVTWNGNPVAMTSNPDGSLSSSNTLDGPPKLTLPTLDHWVYQYETPEAQPGFDDSSWTAANHTTTNNPTKPPAGQPVLYADDYGFHYGDVWYRGHFTPSSDVTSVTLGTEPGARGISEVWLNGTFLGSHDNGSSETNTSTYTVPAGTTNVGQDNVLSVLVRNASHNEASTENHPRGLTSATLAGSSAAVAWKIQGDQGGEDIVDTVRGPQNNGGLYGERAGWYLSGYPDSSWTPVSLPSSDPKAGVAWYRTTFTLDEPAGVDASLALNIADVINKAYRATIFLNGWNMGQYINNVGPQHTFVLPNGILNPNGKNTLAIAVISNTPGSGGLGTVTLTGAPSTYTYDDPDPALQYSGAWSHVGTDQSYTAGDYLNTESFSNTAGDSVSLTFNGTAVRWISSRDTNHGIADVYLDGNKVATVDTYGPSKGFQQTFYSAYGLSDGPHTLKIVVTGQQNPAASGDFVGLDAIDVPPSGVVEGGAPLSLVDSPGYVSPSATGQVLTSRVGTLFDDVVGRLDVPADATGTEFKVRIDWGDGSSSAGRLVGGRIEGTHTYASVGSYPVHVSVSDAVDGVELATADSTMFVYAFAPGGGSFAVGDQSATGAVTFWSDTWSQDNSLSGGAAPAPFKGFVSSPAAPACGVDWSTRVGASSSPPAPPLPDYLGAIVTSAVAQSNAKITGNTVHLVVVKTNPGYGQLPTEHGTGTVVAQIC